jgi:hypothetical protein
MISIDAQVSGRWKIEAIKPDGSRRVLAEFDDSSKSKSIAQAVRSASRKQGESK